MDARAITPILNVSNLAESFAWFDRIGWKKLWDWGDPPGFGAVGSGQCEIFLCENCQGGRGKGDNTRTFGPGGDEVSDKGVWLTIWVDDVDDVHALATTNDVEIMLEPENMPWGVRECHVRHPDGHVFRFSMPME